MERDRWLRRCLRSNSPRRLPTARLSSLANEACASDACRTARTLRLKVIVHRGEAVITRLHGFETLAGEDVILTHRLLKNSVPDEYIVPTDSFMRLLSVTDDQPRELRHENCQTIGEVGLAVIRPQPAAQTRQPSWATAAMANALPDGLVGGTAHLPSIREATSAPVCVSSPAPRVGR